MHLCVRGSGTTGVGGVEAGLEAKAGTGRTKQPPALSELLLSGGGNR